MDSVQEVPGGEVGIGQENVKDVEGIDGKVDGGIDIDSPHQESIQASGEVQGAVRCLSLMDSLGFWNVRGINSLQKHGDIRW